MIPPAMNTEEDRLLRQRHARIARTKRILRRLPRRSNVHRYPGLKWFAAATRKRLYLWSFRVNRVVPALYAGCILTLLPLYGVQIPLSVLFAFWMRANLPVLVALQFLSNPLTVVPLYFTVYQIGKAALNLIGIDTPTLSLQEMKTFLNIFASGQLLLNLRYLLTVWLVTAFGGVIFGSFLATAASLFYKFAAREVDISYRRLRELQAQHSRHEPDA